MSKDTGVIQIHGKAYQTVALRVQTFRELHPDWTLSTEVLERTQEVVVMKASIADDNGRLRATGHSEEYRATSQINRTSALENAETSAIGRALAALGLGGTEFATANEVQNAIHQQDVARQVAQADVRPNADAGKNLTPEQRKRVETLADEVIDSYKAGFLDAGQDAIDEYKLEHDEKLYLWSKLDSPIRSALKKIGEARKKAREETTQA